MRANDDVLTKCDGFWFCKRGDGWPKISSSTNGSALERAIARWLTPFNLQLDENNKITSDAALKAVDAASFENIVKMAREAEQAEQGFNQAIGKVSEDDLKAFWKSGSSVLVVLLTINTQPMTVLGFKGRKTPITERQGDAKSCFERSW